MLPEPHLSKWFCQSCIPQLKHCDLIAKKKRSWVQILRRATQKLPVWRLHVLRVFACCNSGHGTKKNKQTCEAPRSCWPAVAMQNQSIEQNQTNFFQLNLDYVIDRKTSACVPAENNQPRLETESEKRCYRVGEKSRQVRTAKH